MKKSPKDLVQVDTETALVLFLNGYTHIPVMKDNGYPGGWADMQPAYLDELFQGITFFASDKKRAEILNPVKVDLGKLAEDIALDNDSAEEGELEWKVAEPEQAEEIPDEDAEPDSKTWGERVWDAAPVANALGGKIAKLLKEKHIMQRELAEKVGVTEVSISRYVNGERIPRGPIISDIARALDTTTDYLLGMTDGGADA